MTDPVVTVTKRAIDLLPGDQIVKQGSCPNSMYRGTVRNIVVVDAGVQINLVDGCYTRPENEEFEVIRPHGQESLKTIAARWAAGNQPDPDPADEIDA